MESADLLYSGLLLAALMLSLWTAALLTAACFFFAPFVTASASKSAPGAATIASTEGHVSRAPAPPHPIS